MEQKEQKKNTRGTIDFDTPWENTLPEPETVEWGLCELALPPEECPPLPPEVQKRWEAHQKKLQEREKQAALKKKGKEE